MSCLNPVTIKLYSGTDHETFQKVRCRQCEDCKQSMRSAAFIRLKSEYEQCMRSHGMCFFFTLTYADEYIPFKFHRMCFDKRLVQDWIQSFRQEMRRKYGYQVKYFLVSELGHVGTHRPHNHGLLFLYKNDKYQLKSWKSGKNCSKIPFFPQSYAKIIQSLWPYGRCDIQEYDSSRGGIQYVAKYISKFDEEEKLFKDIITRIQIKRGKGNPDKAVAYYANTFPSLHAFMQRYCPFTMISQGLGSSLNLCEKCLIEQKPIFVDGFQYSIPRYYSDRYVRNEIREVQNFVSHDASFSDCNSLGIRTPEGFVHGVYVKRLNVPSWRKVVPADGIPYLQRIFHDEIHPADLYEENDIPSPAVCEKYKTLFDGITRYENMPYYVLKTKRDGSQYYKQVLPKQSEVSQLRDKRKEYLFLHILDNIETKYYALPPLLQDSCSFDIPKLLSDTRKLVVDDKFYCLSGLGFQILAELDELGQVASDWRAQSRLSKMEQKRKEKMERNQPHAKKPLSWEQYRVKSRYLSISKKFKT